MFSLSCQEWILQTDEGRCVPRSTCVFYRSEAAFKKGQVEVPSEFDVTVEATTRTKSYQSKEYIKIKASPKNAYVINELNFVKLSQMCLFQEQIIMQIKMI
ncbi:unnamed protein product [Paramecium pentaurelia]|uniref:Uncharacterized protein n=1 Tax=Paramecium pentaurelia TaxID=43138 RepID=A0A8S1YHQ9_9CILI|nr:unnamed protein product [Paramecium pentaurelia]